MPHPKLQFGFHTLSHSNPFPQLTFHILKGCYEEAITYLNNLKIKQKDIKNQDIEVLLALSFYQLGNLKKAKRYF